MLLPAPHNLARATYSGTRQENGRPLLSKSTERDPDGASAAGDPLPLKIRRSPLWSLLSPVLSGAILLAAFLQLRLLDLDQVVGLLPTSPLFWMVFAAYYLTSPLADFAIFRRLWRVPLEGLIALLRKMVSNELLLGYVGEVYFYSWARRKLDMATSPFGAVKDVAILSALMGNAVTLVMMIVAFPLIGQLNLRVASETVAISVGILMVVSILTIVFSKRLFSLTRAELTAVSAIHLTRIAVSTALGALAWSLVLPAIALSWWVLLSTVKLLLSRLPLLPNKDIVFAGIAVFMVGNEAQIASLMALMASLILLTHLVLGALLAIGDFVAMGRKV